MVDGGLRIEFGLPSLARFDENSYTVNTEYSSESRYCRTRSSQARTADRPPFLFHGACRALGIYSSRPTRSSMLLMHIPSQPTLNIYHAALSPFPLSPPWRGGYYVRVKRILSSLAREWLGITSGLPIEEDPEPAPRTPNKLLCV